MVESNLWAQHEPPGAGFGIEKHEVSLVPSVTEAALFGGKSSQEI